MHEQTIPVSSAALDRLRPSFTVCFVCLFAFLALSQDAISQQSDFAQDVNVFIGTGRSPVNDQGFTMPAASLPFGMISWGPDPVEGGFYRYELADTRGFSLTHLSGVGCPVYGDIPVMPVNGPVTSSPAQQPAIYQATYSHQHESASPGFYSVQLDTGVAVRISVTQRAGIASFQFPDAEKPHSLIFDLSRTQSRFGVQAADVHVSGNSITGSIESGGFCSKDDRYRVYFAAETEEQPASTCTFDARTVSREIADRKGSHIGACLTFPAATRTVHLRAAVSYVSAENAVKNLHAEMSTWDLEEVRLRARAAWNDLLGRVEVSGGTPAQRHVFYTALYHSLLEPSLFNDVDGRYLGFDERVHTVKGRNQYADFSEWDIYRSQVQLIAMLAPQVAGDIAQSLVTGAEEGGGLPMWPVAADETNVMVGDPSDLILASIYAFGARNFDTRAALDAMVRGADDPTVHSRIYPERPMLSEYLKSGYVPESRAYGGSASVTLEYTNADFAIARFAGEIGRRDLSGRYLRRSANWRRLFDPQAKYIRPRDLKGDFLPNFTPGGHAGFVEGNSAQYTWMVPYDFAGVIRAVGGDEAATARLDDYFSQYATFNGGPYFLISNEPSFGDPWIYNWTGHPWRTQEVVAKTLKDLFLDSPGGLPGNDDLGATSSWAVFAMLGLYPEIPAVGGLTLNTPTFSRATLHLDGRSVNILANHAGSLPYIRAVSLGGRPVTNFWIAWRDLDRATTLQFQLSNEPNKLPGARPPSFPADDEEPSSEGR
jgi:predicted alpha-1,2-mannosidase